VEEAEPSSVAATSSAVVRGFETSTPAGAGSGPCVQIPESPRTAQEPGQLDVLVVRPAKTMPRARSAAEVV
jgi:hypothetical protein